MKIGIDIDGVLRDFTGKMIEVISKKYPKTVWYPENYCKYDISTWSSLGSRILYLTFSQYAKEIFENANIIKVDSHLTWFNNNIQVYFISSQPTFKLKMHTLTWLEKNNLFCDGIIFVNSAIEKNFVDILIDDSTVNLENFKGKAICFDQPWNQDWKGIRVKNLSEAYNIIIHLKDYYDN
jgi:5'(3')-deoxyribonucleotidase